MKIRTRGTNVVMGLIAGGVLLFAVPAAAQEKAAPQAVKVEEGDSVASLLKRYEGKAVKLRLSGSGDEIGGKVQKVGKELVHLTDLSGREFYDGVIRIDQVSAVVLQARGR